MKRVTLNIKQSSLLYFEITIRKNIYKPIWKESNWNWLLSAMDDNTAVYQRTINYLSLNILFVHLRKLIKSTIVFEISLKNVVFTSF